MARKKSVRFGGDVGRREFLGTIGSIGLVSTSHNVSGASATGDNGPQIRALLAKSEPATWVLTGDSITQGALHTFGSKSYPELFAERVRWELRRMHDVVINTGISGDTIAGILKEIEWRIFRFQPDVTSIMFGTNDCVAGPRGREGFRQNLNRLLDQIDAHKSQPILHVPNLIFYHNAPRRQDLLAYVEIIRAAARERQVLLVDHYQHWLERHKARPAELLYWLNDGSIHPNPCGHRELAKLMFNRLGIFDPKSRTCRLFVE